MPGAVDPLVLLVLIIGFTASGVVAWRAGIDGGVLWAAGWVALSGAGLAMRSHGEAGVAAGAALSALFAVLMLAGMLRHAKRPVPRWLVIVSGTYIAVNAGAVLAGHLQVGVVTKLVVEPLLFGAAALVAARLPARTLGTRLLPYTFGALALEAMNDGYVVLTGDGLSAWKLIALPVLAVQALVTGELGFVSMARSQRSLRATLARYRAIAESARDVIFEVDVGGCVHYASPSLRDVLGWEPEDLVGKSIMEFAHPDTVPMARAERRRYDAEGKVAPVVGRIRHRDGSWRWLESTSTVTTQEGEPRLIMVARDVTERRQAEEAKRESERRFVVLAERSGAHIAEVGPDAHVSYLSPNLERIFGVDPAQLVGCHLSELARRAGAGDVTDLRPDDTLDDVLARGSLRRMRRIVDAQGRVHQVELEIVEFTPPDAPRRALIVAADVTERVLFEQQLRETQKLESLGVLAGGVAHDFNNLLAIMLGNANLARATLASGAREHRHLAEIETAAERAADLTHQLLSYAGRKALETAPLALGPLVTGMVDLLDSAIPADIRLAFDFPGDLPQVEADAGELQQIVLNLVVNASEATAGAGVIWIGGRRVLVGSDTAAGAVVGELPAPGAYVGLEVRDSGCGMDDDTRARIFDPFFSTKGLGRGLGLAAILGIVRSHGGALRLETAKGRGSRFEVLLPVAKRPVVADAESSAEAVGAHGTVLVVDDEDGVRFAASLALEYGGFRVLTAANGAEAVRLFGLHGDEVVAVVLDKAMPVMNGEEALRELRSRRRDLPVVLTSGFTGSLPRAGSYEGTVPRVLPKPYRSEALVDAVNAAIRTQAASTA